MTSAPIPPPEYTPDGLHGDYRDCSIDIKRNWRGNYWVEVWDDEGLLFHNYASTIDKAHAMAEQSINDKYGSA